MKIQDISKIRTSFEKNKDVTIENFSENPFIQFSKWFEIASLEKDLLEPNAFVLSTANKIGKVRTRSVLLKYFSDEGFVFFTNYTSQKAKDIAENNQVSMLFPWYYLERQMIIEGEAFKISKKDSLKYFMSRPRGSQIGAWVSRQSQIINSRALLTQKAKQITQKFLGKDIPLPDFWGGYIIKPTRFEFWQGQPNRLHNRVEYSPTKDGWSRIILSP